MSELFPQDMTSANHRDLIISIIDRALVSRGKNKGQLKANCPRGDTLEAAAWQAIQGYANPYKLGIFTQMMFSDDQRHVFDIIDTALKNTKPGALIHMDRDSDALNNLGVW
tara:strand:+ start:2410 stop:2742 length:333 start_codon:yes stop_codon:yes gene_type:complete